VTKLITCLALGVGTVTGEVIVCVRAIARSFALVLPPEAVVIILEGGLDMWTRHAVSRDPRGDQRVKSLGWLERSPWTAWTSWGSNGHKVAVSKRRLEGMLWVVLQDLDMDVRIKIRVLHSREVELRLKARGFAIVALGSGHLEESCHDSGQSRHIGVWYSPEVGKVGTVNERAGMVWWHK
jgi:hypothetical protein